MQGPSLVSISKVLSSHHWGMSAYGDDMIRKKKKRPQCRGWRCYPSRGWFQKHPWRLDSPGGKWTPSQPSCTLCTHSQLLHIPYAHKLLALLAVRGTNRHCPGLMKTG